MKSFTEKSEISIKNEWVYLSHKWGPSCPAYAGGEPIKLEPKQSICCGDSCNSLNFSATNHIGTHFDFPLHFVSGGKTVLDFAPHEFLYNVVGTVWFDCEKSHLITSDEIKEKTEHFTNDLELLLIRTGASNYRSSESFWNRGPGIGLGVAEFLRRRFKNIRAIGLDAISISSFQHRPTGRLVHKEFLDHAQPILIIEDMNLEPLVRKSPIKVIALPLRIELGDGAPCTIIAQIN